MKKYLLDITVFICGALVMVFELVGARILGPYVGTSLFVWTSLIGIILGSLSLGYLLGGKLSDRKPSLHFFGLIILFAGVFILFTAIGNNFILKYLSRYIWDIRWLALLSAMVLFAPASIFLGMVSPFAVKLKLQTLQKSGSTVGSLYAISTIGSIAGTFLGGFYLIPAFGTSSLVYLIAIVLLLMALIIFLAGKKITGALFSLFFLIGCACFFQRMSSKTHQIIDADTLYNRVLIYDSKDSKSERPVKIFRINDEHSSAMFLDNDDLVFQYLKYYDLVSFFNPDFQKVLMLGGSGYAYPKYFLHKYPDKEIDVVEIDSRLTDLARQHFRLVGNKRMAIFHEDARTFFNHNKTKYDAILIDVFNAQFTLPFQLTTLEFIQHQYDALTENGLVVVNVISCINHPSNNFLVAEAKTFQKVFKNLFFFAVSDPKDDDRIQNIMIVALKNDPESNVFSSADSLINHLLSHKIKLNIPENTQILTDDFAPVEFYVSKMISHYYGND